MPLRKCIASNFLTDLTGGPDLGALAQRWGQRTRVAFLAGHSPVHPTMDTPVVLWLQTLVSAVGPTLKTTEGKNL
jgi:hypothetical protein